MPPTISIVFCFDSAYAKYAAVAAFSVVRNSRSGVNIYWVTPSEYLEDARQQADILQAHGIEVRIVAAGKTPFEDWKVIGHISRACYLRLLLPELIPQAKVLYLDCDTLVLSDLGDLWRTDMGQTPIAGVADIFQGRPSRMPLVEGDVYINSGVLLMDLDRLRRDDFARACDDIYHRFEAEVTWLDQDVINKYAERRKTILDERWNFQILANRIDYRRWKAIRASDQLSVIHFLGSAKPWSDECDPRIADLWWTYAGALGIPGLARGLQRSRPVWWAHVRWRLEQLGHTASSMKQALLARPRPPAPAGHSAG